MEKKKKTKAAEIWDHIGIALGIIYFMPALFWESVSERLNKKKEKKPKSKPIKFVCSECGEIFASENKEKAMQGVDGFSYYEPIECPKCHGMRTSPEDADISVYEKIWDMDELWSFIQDMEQDWDTRHRENRDVHHHHRWTARKIPFLSLPDMARPGAKSLRRAGLKIIWTFPVISSDGRSYLKAWKDLPQAILR